MKPLTGVLIIAFFACLAVLSTGVTNAGRERRVRSARPLAGRPGPQTVDRRIREEPGHGNPDRVEVRAAMMKQRHAKGTFQVKRAGSRDV